MKENLSIFPFLLISFFFGISFVIDEKSDSDSLRYKEQLVELHNKSISLNTYSELFYKEGGKVDVVQPIITFIVSLFTDNYKFLFGLYAVIFGFFWFSNLLVVRRMLPDKLSWLLILLILFFAFLNPIWYINGFRMWTATIVFIYGIIRCHYLSKSTGIIFIFLSIFIHFSLAFLVVIYLFFRVIPLKNVSLFFIIYIFSFFFAIVDFDLVRGIYDVLPDFLQSRKGYINEDLYELQELSNSKLSLHIKLYNVLLFYIIPFLACCIYFNFKYLYNIKIEKFSAFFSLALFISSFSNIVYNIPSASRYLVASNLLIVFAFIWFVSLNINFMQKFFINFLIKFLLIYLIIIQIRIGLDYVGILFLIGNPILNSYFYDSTPLISFFKNIF